MRAAAGSVGCLVVALPIVVVDGVSGDGADRHRPAILRGRALGSRV